MQKREYRYDAPGAPIIVEFNDLANQANSSCMVSRGDTKILVTASMSAGEKDLDYFPLTVDYEEKFYAAGQILGSRFMRREGKPSDEAVLSGRIIDRTIRPLFDKDFRREVQVVVTVLSLSEYDPDTLGVLGASIALASSDIPWDGPVSAIRIGKMKDSNELTIGPTYDYRNSEGVDFDMVACGTEELVNMIEVGSDESGEDTLAEALSLASEELKKLQAFQKEILTSENKEKVSYEKAVLPEEVMEAFEEAVAPTLEEKVFGMGKDGIAEVGKIWMNVLKEKFPEHKSLDYKLLDEKLDELIHKEVLENEKRVDGRKLDEIRPLYAQAGGISPMLHGSGIFYRGGTHVFSALTLGGPNDSLVVDGMESQVQKRFMHHYNFPPFSVGETGRIGGFNRRMIGHGALAEKAIWPVLPSKETFPYTIRIVSEAFASNGSTSMASVCGSTLALMDAGVPIKQPVAGIAMGIMIDLNDPSRYKILTDIQGPEDHHGDMDFKVAGTRNGVTAIQMDVKVAGIKTEQLAEALRAAKKARLQILDVIEAEIKEPRANLNPNAPHIETIVVKKEQIGMVIGPGGKMINEIKNATGTEIDIEEDGSVFITGKGEGAKEAREMIAALTHEHVAGEKYTGEVTRIEDFGAFVRITPYAEGLVHISEIAPFRVETVRSLLALGDKVPVVIKEIDDKKRINLSIKQADPELFADKKPQA
jgi:polyribonucleotide nucleotidyltransferase